MTEVRTIYWGSTPVFAVDHEEGRELREATFFDRGEAEAFAAEQRPTDRPEASRAAIQRANRTFLDRVSADDPPEPKTLGGLLQRLRSTIQRQTTWVR